MTERDAKTRDHMIRSIDLARRCESEANRISPKVGAIAVRNGIALGEAYRGEVENGEHAEFTLLERKLPDEDLSGATLFTTLEPCTARNPPKIPCADRIIARGIQTVVIGTLDHNPEIRGKGELRLQDAGVEIMKFDSDLVREIVHLNGEFVQKHRPSLEARIPAAHDPVQPGMVGPNGHPVGYTPEGDKVEWLPDDDAPGEVWPLLLRRNDEAILSHQAEFWDKVWYNRKRNLAARGIELPAQADDAMRRIEERYGAENLIWTDFEWGLLSGRLSALAWVMGSEWDESLDT